MTQEVQISKERALDILAAYGSNPARWPANERISVQAWIDQATDVAAVYHEHRLLDEQLEHWEGFEPSQAALDRLSLAVETSASVSRGYRFWPRRGRSLWMSSALAACLALVAVLAYHPGEKEASLKTTPVTSRLQDAPQNNFDDAAVGMVFSDFALAANEETL